ncbi:MAG: ATP-dependent helicase [Acidobacteriota bacterium]
MRQRILECDGHLLVIGGPGSGKTTIALRKAVRRISTGMAPGQKVLFLSFTKAAVARVADAAKIEAPKGQHELLNLQTFHSLFWEILCSHSYLLGTKKRLQILMPQDERVMSEGIKEDKDPDKWAAWMVERERLFREEGRIAFELFGPNAALLLERSEHLRRLLAQRYPLIIVDEAQDTWQDAWHCIELLAPKATIICLADLEQQIFDYIPGIGPERIEAIRRTLNPLEVDLGSQNHRSPGSEIVLFGDHIITSTVRRKPYKGVSRYRFNPNKCEPTMRLRIALAILHKKIKKETGTWARSIAILVPSGPEAAKVSVALGAAEKPVRHKLLFDESEALLAARFAAFLLEPKTESDRLANLATALDLFADIKKASGSAQASRYQAWAIAVRQGKTSSAAFFRSLLDLMDHISAAGFSGDPARDWLAITRALRNSGQGELSKVAGHLDYLVAFKRGKRISANLAEAWRRDGQYTNARRALDLALAQDQILGGIDDPNGVQVMNIHKAKGKQFDGVIVLCGSRHDGQKLVSNMVWWDDPAPHSRSRRILRVAVTRAKVHTLVVEPAWPVCPILTPNIP